MTDPNQPKKFKSKKNGKYYYHNRRHQANERQVDIDIFSDHFEKRHNRKMNLIEKECFRSAYNLGYKEGTKRTKEKISQVNGETKDV